MLARMQRPAAGFLYLAIGEQYRRFALTSIKMLRRHYLSAPCHVISDQPMRGAFTNTVVREAKSEFRSRALKTQLHLYTPFDVSMFIDADACILRHFGGIVKLLGKAAVAVCCAEPRYSDLHSIAKSPAIANCLGVEELAAMNSLQNAGYNATHYDTGVMIFHRFHAAELFDAWHEEWNRFKGPDQMALIRAQLRVPTAIRCLPRRFNWRAPINATRLPVIYHGFKHRRWHRNIPDLIIADMQRAKQLLRRLPSIAPIVAEIGCFRGTMSRQLLSREDLTLFMVDSWCTHSVESAYVQSKDNAPVILNAGPERIYQEALENTNFAANRRRVLRMPSNRASKALCNASLDAVFIDAEHTFGAVKADIAAWLPKVKPGGLLCGHDYGLPKHPGVKLAVDEFAKSKNLKVEVGRDWTWFIKV